MSEAADYERQNFALIHWQGREGIIHRLGHKTYSSFGPLTHSIAQTLALVHDLRLESLQFRFYRSKFDPHTILPNDVQLVFYAPKGRSFLGVSAFVCSSRALGNEPLTLLDEIGESLDGILKRKQMIGKSTFAFREIEKSLLGFYQGELFGNWDPLQDTKLQNYATRDTRTSPTYWNEMFDLVGFFDFPGACTQKINLCPRNHEWNRDNFDSCPLCGSLEFEERPSLLAISFLNFLRKSGSSIVPSDMLRYIAEWPRLGTFVVRTLIQEDQLWGPGFLNVLLLPNQMVFRSAESKYITTLWRYSKESGLRVAVLQSSRDKSQSSSRRLLNYWHFLGKMKWDPKRLADSLNLETVISGEQVGFADKGALTRVNTSLVDHLDGLTNL